MLRGPLYRRTGGPPPQDKLGEDLLCRPDSRLRYAMAVDDGKIVAWFEEPGINDDGSDEDPYGERCRTRCSSG